MSNTVFAPQSEHVPRRFGGGAVDSPVSLAIFLVVAGVIGFWAAFQLTIEKFVLLEDPTAQLGCNYSVLVGCSTNLASWQGEIFGFPNSLLGIAGWSLVIGVGLAILAGARFARWFWITFNLGMAAAAALILFFMYTSFYVLDVLCPRCMVTWVVTIPVFLAVSFFTLKSGRWGTNLALRRFGRVGYGWIALITLGFFLVAAVFAQLQMDFLHRL